MLAEHRERIAQLLSEPGVHGILGLCLEKGVVGPHLFTNPADADRLVLEPKWPLAKTAFFLARSLQDGESIGLVCRGCDIRALIELEKAGQIRPGAVHFIGLECSAEQAAACLCETPYPPGVEPPEAVTVKPASVPLVLALTDKPGRLQLWRDHFQRCIKCYGCRNACPLCVCPSCKLEDDGYVSRGGVPPDPLAFHLIRAMHLADRCVGCGACQESCPAEVPLLALHLAARSALRNRTGYVSGTTEISPLLTAGREDKPHWEETW
jgi:ferredoxin